MSRLPIEKRAQIVTLLAEGNSLRATSRIAGCLINTVTKRLLDFGAACAAFQDDNPRNLDRKVIEADEIWRIVAHKERTSPMS